jgi:hypothetical protein
LREPSATEPASRPLKFHNDRRTQRANRFPFA